MAIRRLLLENVFLLAGRRIPVDANLNVEDEAVSRRTLIIAPYLGNHTAPLHAIR